MPAARIDSKIAIKVLEVGAPDVVQLEVEPLWTRDKPQMPQYQSGLKIAVEVSAPSLDSAIGRAMPFANIVVTLISLISGVGIPTPVPSRVVGIPSGTPEAEFRQYFELPRTIPSQGDASEAVVSSALTNLSSTAPKRASRIDRALVELAAGQRDDFTLDRFLHFWMGLEALNPIFQEDYNPKPVTTKCPNCGERLPVQATTGVRAFFAGNEPGGANLYNRMRNLRVSLSHGHRHIPGDTGDVADLGEAARHALRRALAHYLTVPEDKLSVPDAAISNRLPTRGWATAILSGNPQVLEAGVRTARFDVKVEEITTEPVAGGKPKMVFRTVVFNRFAPGIAARLVEGGIIGEGVVRLEAG